MIHKPSFLGRSHKGKRRGVVGTHRDYLLESLGGSSKKRNDAITWRENMIVDIWRRKGRKKQNSREMRDSIGHWTYTYGGQNCRIRKRSCEGVRDGPSR